MHVYTENSNKVVAIGMTLVAMEIQRGMCVSACVHHIHDVYTCAYMNLQ